jgi:hypothetical protein
MSEFLLVEFDESREVVIDGFPSGNKTGEVIELDEGTHTITLSETKDFSPAEQDVEPSGTSPLDPETIYFTKLFLNSLPENKGGKTLLTY